MAHLLLAKLRVHQVLHLGFTVGLRSLYFRITVVSSASTMHNTISDTEQGLPLGVISYLKVWVAKRDSSKAAYCDLSTKYLENQFNIIIW